MTISNQHIIQLRDLVETSAGIKINTSGDLQRLSELIEERVGYTLSISTLKRIWGKMSNDNKPRIATLDILAQFCGLSNYLAFLSDVCAVKDYSASHTILSDSIVPAHLPVDIVLAVEWNPDRRIIIKHIQDGFFTVVSSIGSKLAVGDRFHCDRLIIGEPCYIDRLEHQGGTSPYYVMGLQGGLTNIEIVDDDD